MEKHISRRNILKTALASSAGGLISSCASIANPSKKRKLGVALVGLGYYSENLLAPALQSTQHCELRGIVTGSPSKIPVWQKAYGIKDSNIYNYDNMHQLANNKDIDIVYVVVPTFLHKKYSVIGAHAGKHIWCEKPMAMTVDECQTIIDACKKNRVQLSIGYRLQHEPNTQTIIEYAKTQPYGSIKKIYAKAGYEGKGYDQSYWRMHRKYGGGAIYDMGVYSINPARFATQMEPTAITATFGAEHPDIYINADESCSFTLEFPNGLKAECATSVVKRYDQLHIDAEKGWYNLKPSWEYDGIKGETSDGKTLDKEIVNQQGKQMDDDALAIINNTPMLVPGHDGLMDIRIVEGAIKSALSNKRVVLS